MISRTRLGLPRTLSGLIEDPVRVQDIGLGSANAACVEERDRPGRSVLRLAEHTPLPSWRRRMPLWSAATCRRLLRRDMSRRTPKLKIHNSKLKTAVVAFPSIEAQMRPATELFRLRRAACLICALIALASSARAQWSLLPSGESSMDTFGGNPETNIFMRIPSDTDDWTRHFRIGGLVGLNIRASFNESGLFNVSGNNAANGIYNDGYVREDQTGDAGGYTGYWGYDNASQYNAVNQTLSMHSLASYATAGSANITGGPFPGFDMAYGDNLWYWRHARVGWELGFSLLPISISDNQTFSTTGSQTTYTFSTSGIIVPSAPYQGGPSGTGEPIISTNYTTSVSTTNGTVTGTRKLDVILYTLRLGPSMYWDLSENFGMSFSAGPVLGLVSGDYKYNETVTLNGVSASNSGKFGATDIVFGGYVNAMLMYHLVANGDIYAGVQYMPMTDAAFSSAGRQARLNFTGQVYFSVGINWPF